MEIPHYPLDSPQHTVLVPPLLKGNTGKDNFEDLMLQSAKRMSDRLTMGRYGVTAVRRSANDVMVIPSKPDFEGAFMGGQQFIIEAKVITKPSFGLGEEFFKASQYNHMRERAIYGVPCFLAVHFNRREVGKSKVFEEAFTVRIHIHPELQHWKDYEAGTLKSISREMALEIGVRIPWTMPKGTRKPLPHFI